MRERKIMLGFAVNAGAEQFRAVTDPGKIQWVDTGPAFPKTQIAIMDGDPSKESEFVVTISLVRLGRLAMGIPAAGGPP